MQFLIDNWSKLGTSACATILNKPKASVRSRVSHLGLTSVQLYTEAELRFLKANYTIYGPAYCAKKLHRTVQAVKRKASNLGLACPQGDPIYCPELDKVYASISAAARELDLSDGNICQVVLGKAESTKGYHFIRINRKDFYNEERESKN